MSVDSQFDDGEWERQIEAWKGVIQHYQDQLYTALVLTLGNYTDAEVVAERTFVDAFMRMPHAAGELSFSQLFSVSLGVIEQERGLVGAAAAKDQRPTLSDAKGQAIFAAVLTLPSDQRTAMVLREIQGLNYEQIAQAMSCEASDVRKLLYMGRSRLLELMREHT